MAVNNSSVDIGISRISRVVFKYSIMITPISNSAFEAPVVEHLIILAGDVSRAYCEKREILLVLVFETIKFN